MESIREARRKAQLPVHFGRYIRGYLPEHEKMSI